MKVCENLQNHFHEFPRKIFSKIRTGVNEINVCVCIPHIFTYTIIKYSFRRRV